MLRVHLWLHLQLQRDQRYRPQGLEHSGQVPGSDGSGADQSVQGTVQKQDRIHPRNKERVHRENNQQDTEEPQIGHQ